MKRLLFLLAIPLVAQDSDVRAGLSRLAGKIRDQVAPSVVAILVERTDDPEGQGGRGARAEHSDYYNRPKGYCTGTAISNEGYILTSAFNVSGTLKSVTVLAVEGNELKKFDAKVLGYDQDKDVALLKIAGGLRPLPMAKIADVKSGDFVFTVGRSPEPDSPTVNFGIVSALHRFGGSHLQTDAEVNYGNVGGPLVTARGEFIGITTHIKPKAHWGQSSGVAFCFKNDGFEKMIEKLKKGESVNRPKGTKGTFLGIIPGEGGTDGVLVSEVIADSPADEAGIKQGDVLIQFDGKPVKTQEEYAKLLKDKAPGDKVKIRVKRKGKDNKIEEKELNATLDEEP